MDVARHFAGCFFTSISNEIQRVLNVGVLDQYAKDKRHAWALNRVLHENVMRYLALCKLYETPEARDIKFDTECDGAIDLVLEAGGDRYAFELKRWSRGEHNRILGGEYDKLKNFMQTSKNHHAYSLIFTDNDNPSQGSSEQSPHIPRAKYKEDFDACLALTYDLCWWDVKAFDTFTVCVMLATPKLYGAGA